MLSLSVQEVGKAYKIYSKPIDSLKEWLFRRSYHQTFWAVREVSFSLPFGGSLGIVGENGAGKSTLLQVLAGTIAQTNGEIERNGRVSAILEMGSGFHPDLSGRENARLGCAVLGLSPEETRERLPSIVAFSELEDFIDRPVKTYSSGMYVRLAFSVVTSVDPDILIVDEALSVGDQHFQKKSMDRMMAFRDAGKTLVFCSHALYFVRQVCEQCLWLRDGRPEMLGPVGEVTESYQDYQRGLDASASEVESQSATHTPQSTSDSYIREATLGGDCSNGIIETGQTLTIDVAAHLAPTASDGAHIGVIIVRNDLVRCYAVSTEMDGATLRRLPNGDHGIRFVIESLPLLAGEYMVDVVLSDGRGMHIYELRKGAAEFRVRHFSREVGVARIEHRWE